MKKRKTTSKNKFIKTFKGQFVTITIKDLRSRNSPVMFYGYLLDDDKEYLFLGELKDGPIKGAIPKSQIAGIAIEDEEDFLMSQINIPGSQEVQ